MLLIKNGKIMTMSGKDYDRGSILIKDKKTITTIIPKSTPNIIYLHTILRL